MKRHEMRPLDLQRPALGVGRTSVEESAWFELMMHFHEVFPLINLAVCAASGGADPGVEAINASVLSSMRDVCF
jgi:hypothetical protein